MAKSAARTDALSTAFMVMSDEEVKSYCSNQDDTCGLLLVGSEDNRELLPLGQCAGFKITRDNTRIDQ